MNNPEQISVNLLKTETIDYAGSQKNVQRIAVAKMETPIYEKQTKQNQLSGLKQNQDTVSQNSSKRAEPIDVRTKLPKTASVSTGIYFKGKSKF